MIPVTPVTIGVAVVGVVLMAILYTIMVRKEMKPKDAKTPAGKE
jgi:formate/nitrite transporter FocA (FNT family)